MKDKIALIKEKYGQLANIHNVTLDTEISNFSKVSSKSDIKRIELLLNSLICQRKMKDIK